MPSKRSRIPQLATALVLGALAAPLAHGQGQGQDLLIGQVSSQTSPVTSVNAKGPFAGVNVYFSHINALGGALKRAGPNPTREKVLKALNSMGELDLGGVYVNYSPKGRNGWGNVELTIIGENGKLLR